MDQCCSPTAKALARTHTMHDLRFDSPLATSAFCINTEYRTAPTHSTAMLTDSYRLHWNDKSNYMCTVQRTIVTVVILATIITINVVAIMAAFTFLWYSGGPHSISVLLALQQAQPGPPGEQQSPCLPRRCAYPAPCLPQTYTYAGTPRARHTACRPPSHVQSLIWEWERPDKRHARPGAVWERGRRWDV